MVGTKFTIVFIDELNIRNMRNIVEINDITGNKIGNRSTTSRRNILNASDLSRQRRLVHQPDALPLELMPTPHTSVTWASVPMGMAFDIVPILRHECRGICHPNTQVHLATRAWVIYQRPYDGTDGITLPLSRRKNSHREPAICGASAIESCTGLDRWAERLQCPGLSIKHQK